MTSRATAARAPAATVQQPRCLQRPAPAPATGGVCMRHATAPPARRVQLQRRNVTAAAAAADMAEVAADGSYKPSKPVLFSVMISNCAARNRFVLYKKGLEGEVDIAAPKLLGDKGVKSRAYLELNPLGKMPLLVLPNGQALPESQVIESYLLDKYAAVGPSLLPPTPEARARAALAARILDLYITPLQGCMYKQMDAAQRCDKLQTVAFQLDVLEGVLDTEGPFVAGADISFGDAALFPTFVFFTEILPKHFGWPGVFSGRPKLERWWGAVQKDAEAARVIAEMRSGLADWESAKRWDTLGISAQVADGSYNWSCS